jgi:hypothetical protein
MTPFGAPAAGKLFSANWPATLGVYTNASTRPLVSAEQCPRRAYYDIAL